jgi:hypothetical protein
VVEDFELDRRVFRVIVEPQSAAKNPSGPRMMAYVLEGDRYQAIMDNVVDGDPGSDQALMEQGRVRAKQFCQVEGKPTLKFRCDKSGLLFDSKFVWTGTAKEAWELDQQSNCEVCDGRHRTFLR